LASLWAEDGVLLQPGSKPVIGKAAIRSLLEAQKQQSAGTETTQYEETWHELRLVDDYAFEWGEMDVTVKLASGRSVHQAVNAIRVLRRETDASWKVARLAATPVEYPYRNVVRRAAQGLRGSGDATRVNYQELA
jgi:uncharacterized protein (TIGR02246 family)